MEKHGHIRAEVKDGGGRERGEKRKIEPESEREKERDGRIGRLMATVAVESAVPPLLLLRGVGSVDSLYISDVVGSSRSDRVICHMYDTRIEVKKKK